MVNQITPEELQQRLNNREKIVLLDVREPWEYEIVHLSGATLIPLDTLLKNFEKLSKNDEIIVYCHTGARSQYACILLRRVGFSGVKNLAGGIDAWSDIDSTVQKY
jgi:rhodanese-related sulfurtransferase